MFVNFCGYFLSGSVEQAEVCEMQLDKMLYRLSTPRDLVTSYNAERAGVHTRRFFVQDTFRTADSDLFIHRVVAIARYSACWVT
jgi:hypothetical protein